MEVVEHVDDVNLFINKSSKFLKKSGFFLVVLNSSKNEIISVRNLSNSWNSKTESEKIAIFQIMGSATKA